MKVRRGVRIGLSEDSRPDQGKDHIPNVFRRGDSPILKHGHCHGPKLLQSELRFLLVTRITSDDLIYHVIKGLLHFLNSLRLLMRQTRKCLAEMLNDCSRENSETKSHHDKLLSA